jgi:MFS family permease
MMNLVVAGCCRLRHQSKKNSSIALLGAAHSFNHSLFVIAPPLLALIMSDLDASNFTIGLVATTASFIYGFGAMVGGPLGDKIGEVKTITISLALSGLSTFIMIAAGGLRSIYAYGLALILMAVWASFYHPTANSLISKTFQGNVAESMGLHGVGGTAGVVLTPTIAYLIGVVFGWPYAFVAFGLLCMLLALIFLKKSRHMESSRDSRGSILGAFRIRELWVLLIFNVMIGLFMKGIELYFPKYLKENMMIDPWWASVVYTLVLAVGVLGQWAGGKGADRIGSKRILIATMAGVCISLISLLFIPVYAIGIALFVAFYGVSFYAHQPALNSLTGFLSPQNQRGAVYGIFFFTSFGIGSLSQVMAGYIADVYGLNASFCLLTVFASIALLLSFKLPDKREGR